MDYLFFTYFFKEGGAPGVNRTRNLVVRSHSLYPIELRAQKLRDQKTSKPLAKGNLPPGDRQQFSVCPLAEFGTGKG